jgi:hypothetical protein
MDLKERLVRSGLIIATAQALTKKLQNVGDEIKEKGLKSGSDFKNILTKQGVKDWEYINWLKEKPDVAVLEWLLGPNKKGLKGFEGLIDPDWVRRNIDKKKIAPKDFKRIGLAKRLEKAGLSVVLK